MFCYDNDDSDDDCDYDDTDGVSVSCCLSHFVPRKNNVIKKAFAASRFISILLDIMQASIESVAVLEGRWCNSCNNEYVRYFDWAYKSRPLFKNPKRRES